MVFNGGMGDGGSVPERSLDIATTLLQRIRAHEVMADPNYEVRYLLAAWEGFYQPVFRQFCIRKEAGWWCISPAG